MKNNKDILIEIQEAMSKDQTLKECLSNIYVLVNDGAVILAGSVKSIYLKKEAGKVVTGVPGVNLLIDDLRVDPVQSPRMGVQIDWANGRMALYQ